MPTKISNWKVSGGTTADQNALKGLYFEETAAGSGQYNLYQTVNGQAQKIQTTPATLQGGPNSTTTFTFSVPVAGQPNPVTFTVTSFFIGHAGMGNWSNPLGSDDDNGTFVAQAGGTKVDELEEDASAASA